MGTEVVVIGHGASPKGMKWGSRIDEHVVMRLKNPSWQTPEDYGKRCDYMTASCETLPVMLEYKTVPKEYFGQPKRGDWSKITESRFCEKAKAPLRIPLPVHQHWNILFRSLTGTTIADCPNHSVGMAAITYAAEFLKPSEILLVGFDNLLNPDLMYYEKADRGKWVTRHDWKAEHAMISHVEKYYEVEIRGFL